jgi:hypothetical protein
VAKVDGRIAFSEKLILVRNLHVRNVKITNKNSVDTKKKFVYSC